MKNTLQKGNVRYIVFKEDETWYAVGLEFNIVESGDDPQETLSFLFEAVNGYIASARKIKARPGILNQKTDAEYEKMWDALHAPDTQAARSLPPVFAYGHQALAMV